MKKVVLLAFGTLLLAGCTTQKYLQKTEVIKEDPYNCRLLKEDIARDLSSEEQINFLANARCS